MKSFRKAALHPHFVILLLVSFCMTIFMLFILGAIYGEDHEKCLDVSFKVENICLSGQNTIVTIQNDATSVLRLRISDIQDPNYLVGIEERKSFQIREDDLLVVEPYIDAGVEQFICRSKRKTYRVEDLRRC